MNKQENNRLQELETILSEKTMVYENAARAERPRRELLQLYKDIKNIREQISLIRMDMIPA
jgi:hypothetical protein